LELIPITGSGE